MPHFLVALSHGARWSTGRPRRAQDGFDRHAAFMDALVEAGSVLLGGPLGSDVDSGDALLLMRAEDEAAVRDILASDPWLGTVLEIKSVQQWTLWLRQSGWASP
ncbi:MAG: YciI family protein [Nocardioidaceae bacterium]